METLALGVDVGTTAVKCALVDARTRLVVASASTATAAYVDARVDAGHREQCVDAVLRAAAAAVRQLPSELRTRVASVGICGQMHGIVWWRAADATSEFASLLTDACFQASAWSRLITWEDQRCSHEFLAELRTRVDAADGGCGRGASSGLASGYGLATYAHTLAKNVEALSGYDTCGTIHDLLAFVLCGAVDAAAACIDTTDAFSWGGFDRDAKNWNWHTVDALGIPRAMLPKVKSPGTVVGHVAAGSPLLLPAGVQVFVPMGDHPCSVLAAVSQSADVDVTSGLSLVNIGTSAQLAMILPVDVTTELSRESDRGFELRPFLTENQVLGVAAALSGGNMFAWLVERCHDWMAELSDGAFSVDEAAIYDKLIKLGLQKLDTSMRFCPTMNGERSASEKGGSIDEVRLHNGSLGDLSASLARGLIENLIGMLPAELQNRLESSSMIGTGNALLRNALLQHFLQDALGESAQLILQEATDAAVGAATAPLAVGSKIG